MQPAVGKGPGNSPGRDRMVSGKCNSTCTCSSSTPVRFVVRQAAALYRHVNSLCQSFTNLELDCSKHLNSTVAPGNAKSYKLFGGSCNYMRLRTESNFSRKISAWCFWKTSMGRNLTAAVPQPHTLTPSFLISTRSLSLPCASCASKAMKVPRPSPRRLRMCCGYFCDRERKEA